MYIDKIKKPPIHCCIEGFCKNGGYLLSHKRSTIGDAGCGGGSATQNQYRAFDSSSNWSGRTTSRNIAIAESLFTVSNSSAFCTRCTPPLAHALMRQRAIAPINPIKNLLFIFFHEIFCKDTAFLRIMQSKTSAYKLFSYEHAIFQWFTSSKYKVSIKETSPFLQTFIGIYFSKNLKYI